MKSIFCLLSLFVYLALGSCGSDNEATPRPPGYFRIDLPKKEYQKFDESCPFRFMYPVYSKVEPDKSTNAEPCWMNINYERFNATLYLSYKTIINNLDSMLEQSRTLAIQHQQKANAMRESPVMNDSAKVYGLIYEFGGNTASSIQFYLTDSTKNFVRGALYFYARPNSDSLAPVYNFLKEDIYKMIESFEWRK